MDFELSEDQKMLKTMVRDFVTKEVKPIAARVDEEDWVPIENIKKMAELGLMGIASLSFWPRISVRGKLQPESRRRTLRF